MSGTEIPLPLSGYVLAGGKSSRMGTDKAMLRFQGVPLIQLAGEKLQAICRQVTILGDRPDLAAYGETLPDMVPDAGPLGGIAAALQHAQHEWLLLLPVDVPLLPGSLLQAWAWETLHDPAAPAARCFVVDGRVQPLVALLHRELAPFVTAAVQKGERKVLPVLEAAATRAAGNSGGTRRYGLRIDSLAAVVRPGLWLPSPIQAATRDLWFANMNSPEEFARASQYR